MVKYMQHNLCGVDIHSSSYTGEILRLWPNAINTGLLNFLVIFTLSGTVETLGRVVLFLGFLTGQTGLRWQELVFSKHPGSQDVFNQDQDFLLPS